MILHTSTPTPYGTPWTWEETFNPNSSAASKAFVVATVLRNAGYEVSYRERRGHRGVITRIRKGADDIMARPLSFKNPRRCLSAALVALLDKALA